MGQEKNIEAHLRDQAKALGGKARKWVSPGNNGVPDRIVMFPGERIAFVETKAPGEKSRSLQVKVQEDLRAMGFKVFADVDSKEKVDALLREVIGT